jgi:tungstate transport system permease protein
MGSILRAFREAFYLIIRFNPDFYRIILLTLVVNGVATVLGAVIGIPAGVALAEYRFPGRRPVLVLVHAMMGLPPVVAGVFFVLIFARSGPLGFLNLLYTVPALILVQVVLAAPIIAGFTNASLEDVDPRIGLQARSLGATRYQSVFVKLREARAGLVAAVIAGFGGVVSEVGAIMIVGGNIRGSTRMLTTDIVLNMRVGKSELALAEGIVLILIAIVVNVFLTRLQAEKGQRRAETKGITGAYIHG